VWQEHASLSELPVEERGDLAKRLLGLGHAIVELVLSVRLTLVDFGFRVDADLAELPVHARRVAHQQVAFPRGQDRGRKAVHISVDGREQRILQIMPVGVDPYSGVAGSIAGDQDVVDHLITHEIITVCLVPDNRQKLFDPSAHPRRQSWFDQ